MTRASLAGVALGTGVAASTALAAVAARHAIHAESSPVQPTGSWSAPWTLAVVVALALYAAAVVVVPRTAPLVVVTAIAIVIQVTPLAGPLLLSKDVYLYWSEARIVTVHGGSPYRETPSRYPADVATPYTSEQWRSTTAPYGPTWEVLALAPAAAAGSSPSHAALAYRLLSICGVIGAIALVARATRNARMTALLGFSPLVALHFGGGGHSDGWLMALVLAGVIAARTARGGAAWGLALAFKPLTLVLLPLELAARRLRVTRGWVLGVVGALAVVVGVSGAFWGLGWVRGSLVGIHGTAPLGGVHLLSQAGLSHRFAVGVCGLVFAGIYAVLLVSAWRRGRARLSLAATALCLTSSLLRPWYGIWPLALAAVEEDEAAGYIAVALATYLVLGDAVSL